MYRYIILIITILGLSMNMYAKEIREIKEKGFTIKYKVLSASELNKQLGFDELTSQQYGDFYIVGTIQSSLKGRSYIDIKFTHKVHSGFRTEKHNLAVSNSEKYVELSNFLFPLNPRNVEDIYDLKCDININFRK